MKYLLIGLGNIGTEYEHTRHNIGFDILDEWLNKQEVKYESGRYAFVAKVKFRGKQVICIKPTTFMNLSGKAVQHWMSLEKVSMENILVITDDIALPLAKIRLKTKGSHGGHNGLKDIIERLGQDQFSRIRFGVGDNYKRGRQVEYVLGKWNTEEIAQVEQGIDRCCNVIDVFLIDGAERAMNQYN